MHVRRAPFESFPHANKELSAAVNQNGETGDAHRHPDKAQRIAAPRERIAQNGEQVGIRQNHGRRADRRGEPPLAHERFVFLVGRLLFLIQAGVAGGRGLRCRVRAGVHNRAFDFAEIGERGHVFHAQFLRGRIQVRVVYADGLFDGALDRVDARRAIQALDAQMQGRAVYAQARAAHRIHKILNAHPCRFVLDERPARFRVDGCPLDADEIAQRLFQCGGALPAESGHG